MTKQFKLNKDLGSTPNLKAGATVSIEMRDGVPVASFWRRRFKDAKVDNCISPVTAKKKVT